MRHTSILVVIAAVMAVALAVTPGSQLPAAAGQSPGTDSSLLYHLDFGASIWEMDENGANHSQLTERGWFAEYSPDNTKIAFGDFYNDGIWTMNADGSSQTQLTEAGGAPTWSPDGRQIAYFVGDAAGASRHIWVMDADGGNARQISDSRGSFPQWSPDGKQIAFHGETNNGIWLINPDGTGETQLYAMGGYPTWSPDGKRIAYVSLSDWTIWIMNADATGHTRVTELKGIHPDWKPDGSRLAYEDLGNQRGIHIVNVDGSNDLLINQVGHAPDWSLGDAQPEPPDLIVESITGPEEVCTGEALRDRLQLRVKNIGSGPVAADGGYFHTDLVLSSDDIIGNGDDILLTGGRDQVTDALAPGQSILVGLAGSNTVPQNTPAGSYRLGAVADSVGNRVAESDETNNAASYPIRVRACTAIVNFSLHGEDALEGVRVNKVVGDDNGPAGMTRLDLVAKLFTFDPSVRNSLSVVLTVPNDAFGTPTGAWVRSSSGGTETPVNYTSLGGGRYRIDAALNQFCWQQICWYSGQLIWRFELPDGLAAQNITAQAEVSTPGRTIPDAVSAAPVRILAPGSVDAVIIANRSLLYDTYADGDVTSLLARLYTEAAGFPVSHSPTGVIYYVDGYSTTAANWDNTAVNYASSATANQTADVIDDLLEDWHGDATVYISIYLPLVGTIDIPIDWPNYVLIVGDDDTIPFYRYDDPSNDEGINPRSCGVGWCVDSATNPAVHATDEDYFFTDNPYADVAGGTDWQTGDVELWIGRLLGASAADMLSLLAEGVDWANGNEGGAVMASVDGWELGLEPDPGGAGHIVDVFDATALLRGEGFAVRNDDNPASEVRTIDVMAPYEGGDANWNSNFRNAANNTNGMDLFFIGGHNSYDHASIPGDDFSPDDTCADATCRYNRFDDDHPIAMIVGCHGGLPVPDIDVPGGVDDDMVYDLIHEGARAFIGATGFSYGSPNNLHVCTWGERLIQHFFNRLVLPPGGNSMAIGKAMTEAKNDYVFGFGSNNALDRKTVTEFNLYGVPWSFVYYPAATASETAAQPDAARGWTTVSGPIQATNEGGVYARTITVTVPEYVVETERVDEIDYALFSIPGGDMAVADGAPILPYVQGYSLALPAGSTVLGAEILESDREEIGRHNVPIARVQPWTEGGLSYTTESAVATPYPEELVQVQQTGSDLLVTVFPIQHNPTSDETTFVSRFMVKVTYEANGTIAVADLATEMPVYYPGETVRTTSTIVNVGEEEALLVPTLEIRDAFDEVMGSQTGASFTVPAGESVPLALAWTGELLAGSYQAVLTLDSEGGLLGGSATGFGVLIAELVDFTPPPLVRPDRVTPFPVTVANRSGDGLVVQLTVTIFDGEGTHVGDLEPVELTIDGGRTATAEIAGRVGGFAGTDHTALARITIGEAVQGVQTGEFTLAHEVYLPFVLRR